MFYLFGIAISASDARYLLAALGLLGTPAAMDAAERIALGITGHRTTVSAIAGHAERGLCRAG